MYLLVSALLGFMAVSGWLGRNNLARLRLDLEPPEEIYDGVETLLTVRLRNRQRRLPACLLQVRYENGRAHCALLTGGHSVRLTLPATFHGRGVRPLQGLRVSSTFPINFFVRSLTLPANGEILVLPRPRPVALPPDGAGGAVMGEQSDGRGYDGDLARIDDYRGGEPLKLIHWKISARQDQLKVKGLSALSAAPLLIDPRKLPGRNLEEQLGGACWLIKTLGRRDRSVGLQLDGRRIPPARGRQHQLRLLGALARYGTDSHPA
jgi:uncharacterized protein (DUF58 family)